MYPYPHLKSCAHRGRFLFDVLGGWLKLDDVILDVLCGYSPLAEHLLSAGYSLTGFDRSSVPIGHLKKTFPEGNWFQASHEAVALEGFSVLLLLGAEKALWTPSYEALLSNQFKAGVRLVLLEGCQPRKQVSKDFYKGVDHFIEGKGYELIFSGNFDARLSHLPRRIYSLYKKHERKVQ